MNIRNISSNQIVVWSALLLGLLVAVMIGSAVGSSDLRLVAGVIAAIPMVVIFVKLKTNIWVLLPIGWYLTGRLPWLPVPFTVRDLCFMAVIFFFTLFFATRALPWKRKVGMLDYLIYINLAYLATVFARNPVGFWAMQSSMVGGRPYFEIALALGAFVILSRVRVNDFSVAILPFLFVIPSWFVGILDVIGRLSPQTGLLLNFFYTGFASGAQSAVGAIQEEAQLGQTRMTGLLYAGTSSMLTLCAKYNPITLISPVYPARVLAFGVSLAAIFLSGFRNALLFAMAIYMMSAVLRGRIRDVWTSASVGLVVLIVLISLQGSFLELPRTMQRALSWLPGEWDQEAVADADQSTRWRLEMWEWAWNDDRIMRDRIWGQGFGLSLDDMNLIASMLTSRVSGENLLGGSDREQFMITGTFHSGPLSTIKYIGAVGLLLYFALMCYMAIYAWRLCKSARGTRAFTLSLFVGIPVIYEPFQFVAIFGALENSYPQTLFWAGLLNLLRHYINDVKHKASSSLSVEATAATSKQFSDRPELTGVTR
jgi:hypothetical protein